MELGKKTAFAIFFGNRGFFPASLQASARKEMQEVLSGLGHEVLMLDEGATRYGAVETPAEGRVYAEFLREHKDEVGGVILCLPNFGDETGAVSALKEAGVPILVQAYPDEFDKMSPELRRDSFCGKFSVMDVFYQYGVKYTALTPHTTHPQSEEFRGNVDYFDRLCRAHGGLKDMVVGGIGARTTAFKTVRFDELALQRAGITTETADLSDVFNRMEVLDSGGGEYQAKAEVLKNYSSWEGVPDAAFDKLTRLGVVLDQLVEECGLDALALRCWVEMQTQIGISPCVLLSEMNNRGFPAACELDVANAVTMYALQLASGNPAACLDWNNNYGEDANKCILFHCGPVPQNMMAGKGQVTDHAILENAVGPGCAWGCNTGRIAPSPFTFSSMLTENGKLKFYLGEGEFTEDPIPDEFFGCAGVAEIEGLQEALQTIGYGGFRHHVSVTYGHVAAPFKDVLEHYFGHEVIVV